MDRYKKTFLFSIIIALAAFILSACGGEEEDMTLQNENWDDINLADKDNPTILFHFTGVN
ncbi:hypothetical protein D7Z54_22100 [Salibacterium salarium]|uniref:Uncharacterized protein n=1 Tax=Salibacterium salarium TaxID=284579 RepID=A0A3R9P4W6_9BACI|nr:hypothetical protein [Salibacterium salarium]RSL31203.1 hypothetical protein D7Z54_22100 [Salibacterium salarium]